MIKAISLEPDARPGPAADRGKLNQPRFRPVIRSLPNTYCLAACGNIMNTDQLHALSNTIEGCRDRSMDPGFRIIDVAQLADEFLARRSQEHAGAETMIEAHRR